MLLRYLVLFAGTVCLITGCNGLLSQHFGTHRLRTIDLAAAADGLGDADFVELTGAVIGEPAIIGPALRASDNDYLLKPVFTPAQQRAWAGGETVTAAVIAWTEVDRIGGRGFAYCADPDYCGLRGLVSEPTDDKNPTEEWLAQRIALAPNPVYLQLGEAPMAWYWNLLLLVGGGLVALVPQWWRFRKRQ